MVPHEDDPVVISIVTVGRRVHRVLIDHRSLDDVMFWVKFNNLQLSPDQLRPYIGFAGDEVEVQGHVELRMTFSDGVSSHTISIMYLVVNYFLAYNLLLGRPTLNRLGAMASTRHMKMKFPSLEGGVIIIKYDQKAVRKCYENSLKNRRGVCTITVQVRKLEDITRAEVTNERRPRPAGEVQEKVSKGKKFKLGTSLG